MLRRRKPSKTPTWHPRFTLARGLVAEHSGEELALRLDAIERALVVASSTSRGWRRAVELSLGDRGRSGLPDLIDRLHDHLVALEEAHAEVDAL